MSCTDSIQTTVCDPVTANTPADDRPTEAEVKMLLLPMILFVLISVADTISSIYMLTAGIMEEYNPLMRWVWEAGGLTAFAGIKVALTIIPVWLFSKLKYERYWLVRRALWATVFGYATIYCLFFVLANF